MSYGKNFLRRLTLGLSLAFTCLTGCAAFNPINGVPARYLPDEMKLGQRDGKRPIDPSLLSQGKTPHLVDSGDILGIYIGGILGKKDENPPVQFSQNAEIPPAAGIPVTVREDGTISLPMVGPINVRGKSEREAEETIIRAYTDGPAGKIFRDDDIQRVLVSLLRPRQMRVLVIRQDSRNEPIPNAFLGQVNIGAAKRGTGKAVNLAVGHNDVLNALVATDGLPGLDAENAVYIIRRRTDVNGQDPLWGNNCDPEELIRNYHTKKPVIRSQNADGWDYQSPQPWSLSEGTQSLWDRSHPSLNSPAVTPTSALQPPQTPTQQPNIPPVQGNWNAQGGWNHAPASQDWQRQNGPAFPSPRGPTLPGQGYSLPDTIAPTPLPGNGAPVDPGEPDFPESSPMQDVGLTEGRRIIRIPMRLGPDEQVDIKKEDIILNDGDIVFIESRDSEVFFTGGLLGGGQYQLPRDKDLNILEALSLATARAGTGAARQIGGVSALNSDVTISPSNVVIIRKLPEGGEIPIKIDLYRARSDLSERIIVQPGDYIYLQYTPLESVGAFIERHLVEGALFGIFSQQLNTSKN